MVEMVYAIEAGERELGWQNIEALAEVAARHNEPLTVEAKAGEVIGPPGIV
jgi:hypothetical protein